MKSARVQDDPRTGSSAATTTTFAYDNLNRLFQTTGGKEGASQSTSSFIYDGDQVVEEVNSSGNLTARYIDGPWADEPLLTIDSAGTQTWLHADERGSILATSDGSGKRTAVNTYDEFGIPSNPTFGRFHYTGQMFFKYLGMSWYKARVYSPTLGRFIQTDPIGYADGANWYNYAGGDPINNADPSGLAWKDGEIVSTAPRPTDIAWVQVGPGFHGDGMGNVGDRGGTVQWPEIVVTARKQQNNDIVVIGRRQKPQCESATGVQGSLESGLRVRTR